MCRCNAREEQVKTIVLTRELIHAGKSGPGGWTRQQLKCIGVEWSELKKGWWTVKNASTGKTWDHVTMEHGGVT